MKKINKIIGVGQFTNFTAKGDILFKKLNLIYAENAMGKTTLANIFRSLSKNNHRYITTKTDNDNYKIEILSEHTNYIFDKNGWKNIDDVILNNIEIYDSVFIEENIHSGFTISPDHKKHLTKLIIGEESIGQNQEIEKTKKDIEVLKNEIEIFFEKRIKDKNIPCSLRFNDFDEFIKLDITDIIDLSNIDNRILEQKNKIETIENRDVFLNKANIPYFEFIQNRPESIDDFKNVLKKTIENIEQDSENKVQRHLNEFNKKENFDKNWLGVGFSAMDDNDKCPFCGSSVIGNELIKAYRDIFNKEYNNFKKELISYKNFSQKLKNNFDKIFPLIDKIKNSYDTFWNKYCKLNLLENLTFEEYLNDKVEFNFNNINSIDKLIEKANNLYFLKEKSLLEKVNSEQIMEFDSLYNKYINSYNKLNVIIKDFFENVNNFKESLKIVGNIEIEKNNLIKLEQKKYKFCIQNNFNFNDIEIVKCKDLKSYLSKNSEIKTLSDSLSKLRYTLNKSIENTIISYKDDINRILEKFNTNFRIELDKLKFNTKEPSTELSVKIKDKYIKQNSKNVDIFETETIGNALSEGDKNSLAFAFFIAKLNHDEKLQNKIVIFDDPMCSLDRSRKTETINQIRYILNKAKSVFVFSHDSYFLEKLLKSFSGESKILHIFMNGENGSSIEEFDLEKENRSCYLQNFYVLKDFFDAKRDFGVENNLKVAKAIRPYLEGFLKRVYPDKFSEYGEGKNKWLADFINTIKDKEIFKEANITELEEIKDFSKNFHHDTCSEGGLQTNVNFTELYGYVERTINFAYLFVKNDLFK